MSSKGKGGYQQQASINTLTMAKKTKMPLKTQIV